MAGGLVESVGGERIGQEGLQRCTKVTEESQRASVAELGELLFLPHLANQKVHIELASSQGNGRLE